ncbi:MAG: hypothetical protein Q9195_006813 [Heterodermia aff. obscurata]
MAVWIQLDRPHAHFTNIDFITGKVVLHLNVNESIASIVVKLEGESKTRLGMEVVNEYGQYDRYDRGRPEIEVHKLLYKTALVFPSKELQGSVPGGQSYTLAAGQHEYPFRFKIPINNDCSNQNSKLTNLNVAGLRVEMARDTNRHIKKTLPPTLTGFTGQAQIRYYVKATVQRPAFYKENYRAEVDFKFLPIEPPRPSKNSRESYARRQHHFAPPIDVPDRPSLFRMGSTTSTTRSSMIPPIISFDGRLPDPAIITCNEPLPLRVLITKLNDSPATIFLQLIEIVLVGITTTRAHELQREDVHNFIIMSLSNLTVPLPATERSPNEMAVNPGLWNQIPLPNTVAPSFDTCNVSRRYTLEVKVGLSWGFGNKINTELMVQTISMPVNVYSGIRPPQALLDATMSNSPLSHAPPQTPSTPSHPSQSFGPPPSNIPADAPPSYEDAIADDLGPIDGPRREYTQPLQPPQVQGHSPASEKTTQRLFPESGS